MNTTYTYGAMFTHFQFNQYPPQPFHTISGTFLNKNKTAAVWGAHLWRRLRQPSRQRSGNTTLRVHLPLSQPVTWTGWISIPHLPSPWNSPRVQTAAPESSIQNNSIEKHYWEARKYACVGIYLLTKSNAWDVGRLMSVWSPRLFWAGSGMFFL